MYVHIVYTYNIYECFMIFYYISIFLNCFYVHYILFPTPHARYSVIFSHPLFSLRPFFIYKMHSDAYFFLPFFPLVGESTHPKNPSARI